MVAKLHIYSHFLLFFNKNCIFLLKYLAVSTEIHIFANENKNENENETDELYMVVALLKIEIVVSRLPCVYTSKS